MGCHRSFLGGILTEKTFIGWKLGAIFDKTSGISDCVFDESCQLASWIFNLTVNDFSE